MACEFFLLHGMGGSPADWDRVTKVLPGIPLSIPPFAPSPAHCALALADEIEQAARGKFALVGYSMGGRLAILTAVELFARGIPPSRLILVSAGLGSPDAVERENRRKTDADWAALAERDMNLFWERWYLQPLFASYLSLQPEQRAAWEKSRIPMDIGGLCNQLRNLGPGSHEHLFPLLEGLVEKGLRVLYIVGELDKKYVELSRIVGEMRGAQVAIVPGAGHILPLEAPEKLASQIREFLN